MNTEQQLRHAAQEMDRATASLAPPPIEELRRSVQARNIGVTVAAAVGVAVLIGGAVLMLRSPGETTLGPAGPVETAVAPETSLADAELLTIVGTDAEPEFDLEGATPTPWLDIEAGVRAGDISQLRSELETFSEVAEVVVLGRTGSDHVYVARGVLAEDQRSAECLVARSGTDLRVHWCGGDGDERALEPAMSRIGGSPTWSVAGRAAEGSSVVVLEIGEDRYWQRTKDGYAFLQVVAGEDEPVGYVVYDSSGEVLEGHVFYNPQTATATTDAVPDDGTCSGSGVAPSALALSSIPLPVAETLFAIVEAARVCDFEALADVSADMFTASFGGMDPVELWTFEEDEGYEPMRSLMQILDMPYGTTEVDGRVLFIWPAAAAHDGDWTTVPEADKEALRPLYDDDDFAGFEAFGGYIGYRTGIYEDGDWSFFVAGD